MRQLETKMLAAVRGGFAWQGANTSVTADGTVYLHGNRIAYREGGVLVPDLVTFAQWPTVTTRSRLRALGLSYPYVKLCRGAR